MRISKGFAELVSEAEAQTESLTPEEVQALLSRPDVLLVDLRDVRELAREGKISGALHVPRGMLEFWVDPDSPYFRQQFAAAEQVILYCNKGWRSALAALSLQQMGAQGVAHMSGGFERWLAEQRPFEKV
jgi:rhodanese-related sulfurtransferase